MQEKDTLSAQNVSIISDGEVSRRSFLRSASGLIVAPFIGLPKQENSYQKKPNGTKQSIDQQIVDLNSLPWNEIVPFFAEILRVPSVVRSNTDSFDGEMVESMAKSSTIQKQNGDMITLIYGLHDVIQDPEDIPPTIDFLSLETTSEDSYKNSIKHIGDLENNLREPQYPAVIAQAKQDGVPILFTDVGLKNATVGLEVLEIALPFIEGKVAYDIFTSGKRDSVLREASKINAGAWWANPSFTEIVNIVRGRLDRPIESQKKVRSITHKLHPEILFVGLTLRNLLISTKLEIFAQTQKEQTHVGMIIGRSHTYIEEDLKTSIEDKLKRVKKFALLYRAFFTEESLTKVMQVDYKEKKWIQTEIVIPELAEIFS